MEGSGLENFFEKITYTKKYAVKQNVLSFQEDGQKCKMVIIKIEFSHLSDRNILPFFKRVFKQHATTDITCI